MRSWSYTWKSSDGIRHEGEIQGETRDGVFAELRSRGIRPIKVIERGGGDGARRHRRHVVVLLVLASALAGGAVAFLLAHAVTGARTVPEAARRGEEVPEVVVTRSAAARRALESNIVELKASVRVATPRPRKHIEASALTNLNEVFQFESERYLARFASPGAEVPSDLPPVPDDLYDALDADILVLPEDPKPVVDLKRVVAGLKEDARRHISVGASLGDWGDFLVSRQKMEMQYRARIIDNFADDQEEQHRHLRALGFE